MKVTLVWTDYPGQTNAQIVAVNDLDLITSTVLFGSNPEAGNFKTQRDALNNVEQTIHRNVKAGAILRVREIDSTLR